MRHPFSVFPVNAGTVNVRFLANQKLKSFTAKLGGYPIVKTSVSGKNAVCSFDPAYLMPGKYDLQTEWTLADGSKESSVRTLEICNALRPKDLLQVNTWGESGPDHEKYGVTMFSTGLDPVRIDNAARQGIYGTYNYNNFGQPRPGHAEDVFHTYKGKASYPNPRSEYIRQDVVRSAVVLADLIKDAPTFMTLVLNSERAAGSSGGPGAFDFSPSEVERAAKMGLDLNLWRPTGKLTYEEHHNFMPMGYYGIRPGKKYVPADGVIPEDNPLYAYHMERHSSNGGTDVVLNDLIAKTVLKVRPDMFLTQDPILRRPAIRSYKKINNAADWCYYLDMNVVVNQVERLGCITRGNPGMNATSMPQFLFKEGTAAPYSGLPPHEMFREASYLAVSRPAKLVTFWNFCTARKKGKHQTVEEIEALTGTGSWKETAAAVRKVKCRVYCYVPELLPEFKRLSDTLWYPFGGLFPKWKNAPRKAALVRSFCCDLFGGVHWPGHENGQLGRAFVKLGIPYDILYDQDLMDGDLSVYDLIVIPDGSALPSKGVKNLLAFRERGGVIVADQYLRVKPLMNAATILKTPKTGADKAYQAKAKEIYDLAKGKTDSPAYIEGMQTLEESREASGGVSGLADLVKKSVKTDFVCVQNQVYWNHLQSSGADYLFAVNDLRIPGRVYGRFGKVREKGIGRTVEFLVRNPKFAYAYDLSSSKEIPVRNGKISFELGPCMGKILLFTEKKLGSLSVKCNPAERGKVLTASVRIKNGTGLVPVLLDLFDGNGKKLSLSRSDVVKNGVLERSWIVPLNAPEGTWRLTVRELACGQKVTVKIPIR